MRPYAKKVLAGLVVVAVAVAGATLWAMKEITDYGASARAEGFKAGEQAALGKPYRQDQLPPGAVKKSLLSIQVEPVTAKYPFLVIWEEKKGDWRAAQVMTAVPPGDKFSADGEILLVQYKAPARPAKPGS
ncbi:MAG: hypothetical protein Q8Q36_02335 [bacterium]|nr:hypothetical protein [bacterium]